MQIILHNESPFLKTKVLAQIAAFVAPKDLPEEVIVEYSNKWYDYDEEGQKIESDNYCSWDGTAYYPNKVVIIINENVEFPLNWWVNTDLKGKYIRGTMLNSLEEFLVYCTAHEIRHIEQWNNPKLKFLYQDFKGDDETDADLYAILKLNEWRLKYGF